MNDIVLLLLFLGAFGGEARTFAADLEAAWRAQGSKTAPAPDGETWPTDLQEDVFETAEIAEAMYTYPTAPRLTAEGSSFRRLPDRFRTKLLNRLQKLEGARREMPDANMPMSIEKAVYLLDFGKDLENELTEYFQGVLEKWTGTGLQFSNSYGIRCYTEGSTLSRHVDNPYQLVSVIVPVLFEAPRSWPLYIEAHEHNRTKKVVLEPGNVLLYESYRLPHWRPAPLTGISCNLFLHWGIPTGYDTGWAEEEEERVLKRWKTLNINPPSDRRVLAEEQEEAGREEAESSHGYEDDEAEDDGVEHSDFESSSKARPAILLASEYKTGTHLASDLARALDVVASDYKIRTTRSHDWVNLDKRILNLLRRHPEHCGILFFRDPVEVLASSYLYSRNTSDCEERKQLYADTDDPCDLKEGVTPELWESSADGIIQMAGPPMTEQIDEMDRVLRSVHQVPNAYVVWMDAFTTSSGQVNVGYIDRAFEFLFGGDGAALRCPRHPSSKNLTASAITRAAERAKTNILDSLDTGGAGGRHIHAASDRKEVVAEIHRLAENNADVGRFVELQRSWRVLRRKLDALAVAALSPHDRTEL